LAKVFSFSCTSFSGTFNIVLLNIPALQIIYDTRDLLNAQTLRPLKKWHFLISKKHILDLFLIGWYGSSTCHGSYTPMRSWWLTSGTMSTSRIAHLKLNPVSPPEMLFLKDTVSAK
jgi:hypothetical protein